VKKARGHAPMNWGGGRVMKKFFGGLGCLVLLLTACPDAAIAAQRLAPLADASAPAKLAIAGGAFNSTDIVINADPDASVAVDLFVSSCQQGSIHMVPKGSLYLEDVTNTFLCGGRGDYYLIDQPAGARAFTMVSFHNGAARSSYKMPALGAVVPFAPQTFGLDEALTNTDHNQVRILCGFPDSQGSLDVDVYGADAELVTKNGPEHVDCAAPITLQPLKTKFQSGYVVIRNVSSGAPGYGERVYGAVVNSSADNGNARIYPFGDSASH
jgi:hypothetical protein